MVRLLRWVLALWLMLVLTLGIGEILGRAQPSYFAIPEIRQCGAVLCYLGVLPGKTTVQDAQAIVKNTAQFDFSNPIGPLQQAHKVSKPFYDIGFENSPQGLVDAVDLGFPSETDVSIGAIIAQLGAPCRVRVNMDGLGLGYPGLVVFADSDKDKWILKAYSPISQISIVNTGNFCQSAFTDSTVSVWHGFGSYPR